MSNRPCANEFSDLIDFRMFPDRDPDTCPHGDSEDEDAFRASIPCGIINYLCEAGKAGYFVHFLREGFPQWMTLCRLEEALVDNRQNEGWVFVVGSLGGDEETQGWLEYEDWIIVPFGPDNQKSGAQVGVWRRDDFDLLENTVVAFCAASDESGILLNRMVKATCPKRYPLGTRPPDSAVEAA